jgi:hypothetical protein
MADEEGSLPHRAGPDHSQSRDRLAPSEKLKFALNEFGQRLQGWNSLDPPLSKVFLEPLLRFYENASGSLPEASWTRPADGSKGRPASPFGKFLVMIFEALPKDAQRFVSLSPEALIKQAERLIDKRQDAMVQRAQDNRD